MFSARKIALFVAVAAQANAFAEGEKSDKELQKAVVSYGLIQGYANLADSQLVGTPEFQLANVRFGLKVSEGITRAQLETQLFGNLSAADQVGNGLNGVGIRRADVGLALPSNTTLSLGRTRLGGADAWGLDATSTVNQFGAIDGASIVQKLSLGGRDEMSFSLGVGNSMGFPAGRDSRVFSSTLKSDRGVIAGARLNYQGIVAAAFYGMENDQVQQEPASPQKVVDSNGGDYLVDGKPLLVKTERKTLVRDVSHFEGSLGYNRENWAFGGWYESIVRDTLNVVSSTSNGKFTTIAAVTADAPPNFELPKYTTTNLGFGFNGDSQLFGVGDLLQKGDLITYGLSASFQTKRTEGVSESEESKGDVNQYVLGVGYAAGGFQVELGQELVSSAGANVFGNKNGEEKVKKSASRTYLVGIYSF